jgi:hypothetical protein
VETKTNSTCFRIYTAAACAWSHAGRVEKKLICHTQTAKEKQCNNKKQAFPLAVLWQPQNRRAHIK